MRLIDADAFNDWMLSHFNGPQSAFILTLQGFIAEQPTAYETDTVVAELEMKIDNVEFDEMLSKDEKDAYMDAYRRAIEIVKGGGVNE